MLPKLAIEYLYLPGHVGEELPLPSKQGEACYINAEFHLK